MENFKLPDVLANIYFFIDCVFILPLSIKMHTPLETQFWFNILKLVIDKKILYLFRQWNINIKVYPYDKKLHVQIQEM